MALATHNSTRFLEAQLLSMVRQDVAPFEVVVSDDASTDGTLALATAVLASEPGSSLSTRILPVLRSGGVVKNYERAVRECRGDVIALCDHDDVWHGNRLSRALPLLADVGPALVFSNARLIDASGAPTGTTLFATLRLSRWEKRAIRGGEALSVLLRRNVVTGATVLVTRDLVHLALPFPESWVHDEWLAAVAAATGTLSLVDECLIDYRIHDSNQIGVVSPRAAARLKRASAPRGGRHALLHRKYTDLAARLESLGVGDAVLATVRRKIAFEAARAAYPASRWRRLAPVLRQAHRYRKFSSQRLADIARDLLQPA